MNNSDIRNELYDSLYALAKNGFKCFITKINNNFYKFGISYGYIITPKDSIICIERDPFYWCGWNFTIKFIPSKDFSDCKCFKNPIKTLNREIVLQAEEDGLNNAKKLKARFYKSSEDFFSIIDISKNIEEIKTY